MEKTPDSLDGADGPAWSGHSKADPAAESPVNAPGADNPDGRVVDRPPLITGRRAAQRRWLPWLCVTAAIGLAVVATVSVDSDTDEPIDPENVRLSSSQQEIVYRITGKGPLPRVEYTGDGTAEMKTAEEVTLPWRRALTLDLGPGTSLVRLIAYNTGQPGSVSCSISVDGQVVHQATVSDGYSAVSCSASILATD